MRQIYCKVYSTHCTQSFTRSHIWHTFRTRILTWQHILEALTLLHGHTLDITHTHTVNYAGHAKSRFGVLSCTLLNRCWHVLQRDFEQALH